jgi:serine/threonine-protein kinase RsbT
MESEASTIPIRRQEDIVEARLAARQMAQELGFSGSDLVMICTVVSEMARSVAEGGEILLSSARNNRRRGMAIVGRGSRPGARDWAAQGEGDSTLRGYSLSLRHAQRSMDNVEVISGAGDGITVSMKKWLKMENGNLV